LGGPRREQCGDLPIMVCNWERGVAVEISWETAIELAKIARVIAITSGHLSVA
jgi:hypothetical protein